MSFWCCCSSTSCCNRTKWLATAPNGSGAAAATPNGFWCSCSSTSEFRCCCSSTSWFSSAATAAPTGFLVKDEKIGTCYRADHLLKDFCNKKLQKDLSIASEKAVELKHVLATLDDLSPEELGAKIKEYEITTPDTKNLLLDPYPFNLMFQTFIGLSSLSPGYMRPKTAQGIFVNFKDLYYYNGNKLPFAAAQIGQAFRNEISPREGLLRVREFTLAEIEHFVDPEDKSHPKYSEVANLEFLMFPSEEQMSGQSAKRIPLGEAISRGIINNKTLG